MNLVEEPQGNGHALDRSIDRSIEQPNERSIGQLFGELATETSTLVRQEVRLTTAEVAQKAAYAGRQSIMVVGGGVLAIVAVLVLAGAITLLLGLAMPLWLSALIVAIAFAAIAYGIARAGIRALKNMDLKLTQTIGSLKDDKTWLTKQIQ